MRHIVFELCAETLDACLAAREGGASRIELCSGLSEGGLTPSHGLIAAAVQQASLPIHVLIRPRGGNFHYSDSEFDVMLEDVHHAKRLNAAGIVIGVLTEASTVDLPRMRQLVEAAHPIDVTFHRAFDETIVLYDALEDVIAVGCDRVLTSGGHQDVLAGAEVLRALVLQAEDRIDVAVGGGLRMQSATHVAEMTGAEHFHGSLRKRSGGAGYTVDSSSIRKMLEQLTNAQTPVDDHVVR